MGWHPGPGERGSNTGREWGAGEDSGGLPTCVVACPLGDDDRSAPDDNSEASREERLSGVSAGGFEEVDGNFMHMSSVPRHRMREPLPVRTVAVRIRPDVLCGAVMDALTTSVERVGGEMTKRQGGVSPVISLCCVSVAKCTALDLGMVKEKWTSIIQNT